MHQRIRRVWLGLSSTVVRRPQCRQHIPDSLRAWRMLLTAERVGPVAKAKLQMV